MPLALYLLALAIFAMGTSEFMLAGLVPDIAISLNVSVGTAGLLTSAFAVGMIVGAPTMAAFARRWPARATLLGCVVVFAVCHVVAAITPTFSVLFATRVLAAVANAGFLAVALSTATRLVAPDQKGRALAVLLSGTTIATVAGVPAGALLGTAMGWRTTFWAVALLCVPAAAGIVTGIRTRTEPVPEGPDRGLSLGSELTQLRAPRLFIAMLLGALVNGGTFAAFTFLAPVVTGTAELDEAWVPLALVLFGIGSFVGVTAAGRLCDQHPRLTLGVASPILLLGWLALALLAGHAALLLILVFVQGVLAFAVGSTLIARVLYAASEAPTMGGSYATAALNIGAAAGPAIGAVALAGSTDLGPVWVAAVLTGIALLMLLPSLRLIAPQDRRMEVVG
ncbi:Cmx/CmrA family chloramphenicol efflux MFS transporter [Dactylosporangium sp. AC04546]|uniref:Cmx/CmrA family chloramphenicol efflux MFS transporter n=1 Tax=Dactylosporangium sp. AC04546 TaxID=2862460 RepID=UPI001EDCF354|nr:Cmx/CmrA family chloramphenicol efflux MFS transporter [Dactylosporangium sp. AC04546]WVK79104.1 Cmx/CmrA family chloramphenicol efflux MFS transporter [Dactylosporangium sp. AC04546]